MSILNCGGDNSKYQSPLRPFSRSKMVTGANQEWHIPTGHTPPPHSQFVPFPRPAQFPHSQPALPKHSAPPRAGMPPPYNLEPFPDSNEPITAQDVLEAMPMTFVQSQRETQSAYMPFIDPARKDQFYKRYLELSDRVAQKYPNQGPPVERQGRAGASWRHIKEVQGHNNRVLYVDGTVRLYDRDYLPTIASRNLPLGLARQTPGGVPKPLHREIQKQDLNWKPTQSARPVNATTSFLPGAPSKYKGFYTYT